MAATAPRMAAANPFGRQRAARQRAVRLNRVHRVLRARRRETAAARRAEQESLRRRNRELIGANGQRNRRMTNDETLMTGEGRFPNDELEPVSRVKPLVFDIGVCFVIRI